MASKSGRFLRAGFMAGLFMVVSGVANADFPITVSSGNWTNAGIWSGGSVPGAGDTVICRGGTTTVVNQDFNLTSDPAARWSLVISEFNGSPPDATVEVTANLFCDGDVALGRGGRGIMDIKSGASVMVPGNSNRALTVGDVPSADNCILFIRPNASLSVTNGEYLQVGFPNGDPTGDTAVVDGGGGSINVAQLRMEENSTLEIRPSASGSAGLKPINCGFLVFSGNTSPGQQVFDNTTLRIKPNYTPQDGDSWVVIDWSNNRFDEEFENISDSDLPQDFKAVPTYDDSAKQLILTIDDPTPTVDSVIGPAANTYALGENLDFTVNFSEDVNVGGGPPQLSLAVGGSIVNAPLLSGSGSDALVFRYTVQAGDEDTNGVVVGSLLSNGATIEDDNGNTVNLTLNNIDDTSDVLVDGVRPTVTGITPSTTGPTNANSVDFTVNFSEDVVNFGVDDIQVNHNGTSSAGLNIVPPSGPEDEYTVTVGQLMGSGDFTLEVIAGADAADEAGNGIASNVTSAAVTLDNTPPNAACQNVTVNLSGDTTVTAAEVDNGSTDNEGTVNLALQGGPQTFGCADVGTNTDAVTLIVTDGAGNSTLCSADVEVVDDVDPIANCQDVMVNVSAGGTITPSDINDGSSDNCGVADVRLVGFPAGIPVTCANVGTQQVTLEVEDVNGNTATCTAQVEINDDVVPNAECINGATFGLSMNPLTVDDIDDGSVDTCDANLDLTVSKDGGPFMPSITFDCADVVGTREITLRAEDDAGNVDTCTTQITVVDDVDPVAVCQNLTLSLDSNGEASVNGIALDDGSTDNCDGVGPGFGVVSFTASPNEFDCSNLGPNQVTLTVEDQNGNEGTCTSTVTIQDNTPPTAVCKDITVNLSDGGTVTGADVDDGSTDNCGIQSLTLAGGPIPVTCGNVGVHNVTLQVTDLDGTTATCTATVTIVDDGAPVMACQDVTVNLSAGGQVTAAVVDDGSTDNCGITSLTLQDGDIPVTCANVGSQQVTLEAEDAEGNRSMCMATVTIVDDEDPVAVCTDIALPLEAGGTATLAPADIDGGSSDNCGIATQSVDFTEFGCSAVGETVPVTLTVEDASGNTANCTAQVTITDPLDTCGGQGLQVDQVGDAEITKPSGGSHTFQVSVSGSTGAVNFQWLFEPAEEAKDFVNLMDGGNITGATTDTLTIDPLTLADAGDYVCEVSDAFDAVQSSTFTLNVGVGMPLAGGFGLALLTALGAAGGALTLRRRK